MSTTNINEHTEQNAKSKGGQLLEKIDLRDYFAAKALTSITAPNPVTGQYPAIEEFEACAEAAYSMADAMLKARNQ